MSYRNKICPQCYTEHKKRGPYCSKACSNAARVVSKETRQKMSTSQSKSQSKGTERWEESRYNLQKNKDPESRLDPVAPPTQTPLGSFKAGKDLWFED